MPLVVDMDGTLVRTDTMHEALIDHLATGPGALASLFGWLGQGKAAFKRRLADMRLVPAAGLPYNEAVLDLVREHRAAGGRVALVSASDHRQAAAVAAHLGVFDEVHGTGGPESGDANLSGPAKAAFLIARFGAGGYDYVGDATVDAPVWAGARRALTVRADGAVRAAAEASGAAEVRHLDPAPRGLARFRPHLRAMRPHQWSKNVLVFAPVAAAHDPAAIPAALAAFLCFCLIASSVYVLNDLLDLQADRAHPRKRRRPLAAGDLSAAQGVLLAALLMAAALSAAVVFTEPVFIAVLALYYVATFAYSTVLKRKLIVDILTLAGLYAVRILGGAAATGVALSPWMLAFAMFLFLALAAVKRQAELADQARDGRDRTPGRAYLTDDLPVLRSLALAAGNAAVMVFALYINNPNVATLYARPEVLWLICPLLLYWILRMVTMTHRGYMTDDPIIFAAQDRISHAVIGACALVVAAAML